MYILSSISMPKNDTTSRAVKKDVIPGTSFFSCDCGRIRKKRQRCYCSCKGGFMTTGDLLGLIFSYVFAFALLFSIEAIRRWRNYPTEFTRKLVHIGAGMWIWVILLLFDHWQFAIIPTASFIIFNAIFLRYHVFSAMDPKEGATPGTVYFAFSCTLLLFIFHTGCEQSFPRGLED